MPDQGNASESPEAIMLNTALQVPARPVSLPVPNFSRAAHFVRGLTMIVEEHRRALVATARANEQRSHSPAVRALYLAAVPGEAH
jgi:hypothetical protein